LDRDLKLTWLDAAAAITAQRLNTSQTQAALMAVLEGDVRGITPQSGRGKTVTVLRRVWYAVPSHVQPLRDRALDLLREGDVEDRLALHWSMLLATHPFFADLTTVIGKALVLQASFDRQYVFHRLVDRWGDRTTLARSVPRVLASLLDWGVIAIQGQRIVAAARRLDLAPGHAAVLLEAAVLASPSHTSSLASLVTSPMIFPFDVQSGIERLRASDRFVVHREGVDVDVVSVRRDLGLRR
jgi:hypothetical protein